MDTSKRRRSEQEVDQDKEQSAPPENRVGRLESAAPLDWQPLTPAADLVVRAPVNTLPRVVQQRRRWRSFHGVILSSSSFLGFVARRFSIRDHLALLRRWWQRRGTLDHHANFTTMQSIPFTKRKELLA